MRPLRPEDLAGLLFEQMHRLQSICRAFGASMRHVKPHGALYNRAAVDVAVSTLVVRAIVDLDDSLFLYGLSGGVLACAALAEHDLTGDETYYGFTPYDTRTPGVDTLTVGWFASLVPVTVPVADNSFPEAVRAAQNSFDAAKNLAGVPFDRVLELTTPAQLGIELSPRSELMVSFLDLRKIPLAELFEETNWGTYGDNLSHGGTNIWINRHADKTTVTISFPDNPIARASVHRYIAALKGAFARVVKTTSDWVDAVADHANAGHHLHVISR